MLKFAIRLHKNKSEAHLIFHATPNETRYFWQWYVTEDKNVEGNKIEGQEYQSYPISTELIKKKGFNGLYLYCKFIHIDTNQEYKTEYIRLYSDVDKIIEEGTVFDDISQYNEEGNIVKIS